MSLEKDIEYCKRKLIRQGVRENFGQKEVRKLRDKYGDSKLIDDFEFTDIEYAEKNVNWNDVPIIKI